MITHGRSIVLHGRVMVIHGPANVMNGASMVNDGHPWQCYIHAIIKPGFAIGYPGRATTLAWWVMAVCVNVTVIDDSAIVTVPW